MPDQPAGVWVPLPGAPGREILVPEAGDHIGDVMLEGWWQQPPASLLALDVTEPGGVVLDLGAHIGTFALLAAHRGFEVIAVEASPINVAMLEASIRHNELDITVVHAAVGDRSGTVRFGHRGPHGQVVSGWHAGAFDVPLRTVDDIVAELAVRVPALVKLDVEGSELAAISGMRDVLQREPRPLVLYESNTHTLRMFGVTSNELVRPFEDLGFGVYVADERHHALVAVTSDILQPDTCVDYLAAPGPISPPSPWRLRGARTDDELATVVRDEAGAANPHQRAAVAATLASAPAAFLARGDVRRSLEALAIDPADAVADAVAWYRRSMHEPDPAGSAGLAVRLGELSDQAAALRDRVEHITRSWH